MVVNIFLLPIGHQTNLHDNRGYNDQNYNNPGLGHDKDLHKGKGKHKNQRTNGQ